MYNREVLTFCTWRQEYVKTCDLNLDAQKDVASPQPSPKPGCTWPYRRSRKARPKWLRETHQYFAEWPWIGWSIQTFSHKLFFFSAFRNDFAIIRASIAILRWIYLSNSSDICFALAIAPASSRFFFHPCWASRRPIFGQLAWRSAHIGTSYFPGRKQLVSIELFIYAYNYAYI